jgi:hypothetical protein
MGNRLVSMSSGPAKVADKQRIEPYREIGNWTQHGRKEGLYDGILGFLDR